MPTDCERWQLRDWRGERQRWRDKSAPVIPSGVEACLAVASGKQVSRLRRIIRIADDPAALEMTMEMRSNNNGKLNVTLFWKTQQEVDHE